MEELIKAYRFFIGGISELRPRGELSQWCGRSGSRSCEFSLIFGTRIDQTDRSRVVCVCETGGKDL